MKSVVWLCGMPRSGTSWVSQILDSHPEVRFKLSPLFSYRFKNAMSATSNRDAWCRFFEDVYSTPDDFMDQSYRREEGAYPVFDEKSDRPSTLMVKDTRYHNLSLRLVEKLGNLKLVYLVRHPAGAIHSWLTAPKEFPADADPSANWRSGQCRKTGPEEFWGFEDWKFLTRQYLKLEQEFRRRVRVVRYESMVSSPEVVARDLMAFLDLDWHGQTAAFIHQSRNSQHPSEYAVFRSKEVKDRWRTELDPRIVEQIREDLTGSDLESFL